MKKFLILGPDPGYGQRGFTPAFGNGSICALKNDFGAGAGHRIENLIAELQGNPHFDGNEVERDFPNAGGFGGWVHEGSEAEICEGSNRLSGHESAMRASISSASIGM